MEKKRKIIKEFYLSLLFLVGCFLYVLFLVNREPEYVYFNDKDIQRIKLSDLAKISSSDFIDLLKKNKVVYIYNDGKQEVFVNASDGRPYIKAWPSKSDISYLLNISSSNESCGVIWNIMRSISLHSDQSTSTVGDISLMLLNAIKEDKFFFLETYVPTNIEKDKIISWAEAEIHD